MAFCTQCGTELEGRFCHNCGTASPHAPQAAPLESSGGSVVSSVEYHPGYDRTAATPSATQPAPVHFKIDARSSALVRAAGFWWLGGLIILALYVYVLALLEPMDLSSATPDQVGIFTMATDVGRLLGASAVFAVFSFATWWLFRTVRGGSNLSRRILQIGWPVYGALRGMFEVALTAAAGFAAVAIAEVFVFGAILALWIRMALLLGRVSLPSRVRTPAGTVSQHQGAVVVFRTEIPAFFLTLLLVVIAGFQLYRDLKK
jgi:hypothetical protein